MRNTFLILFVFIKLYGIAQEKCDYMSYDRAIDSAFYFEDRKQYIQAIYYYEKGLSCAVDVFDGRENQIYTNRLMYMGYALLESGQYNRALDSLKASIEIYQKLGLEADSDCAYAWLLLGKTYFMADPLYHYSAVEALDTAAKIYQHNLGELSKQSVWVLRAYGEGYFFTDKNRSLSYYEEAKRRMIAMRYWTKSLYAVNEQDIATVKMAQGRISEENIDVYRKQLKMSDFYNNPADFHTLSANLTGIYLKHGSQDSLFRYLSLYQKSHQHMLSLAKVFSYDSYLEYKKKLDGKQKYSFSALYQVDELQGRFSSLAYAHALFEKSSIVNSYSSTIESYPSKVINTYYHLKDLRKLNAVNSPKGALKSKYDLDSLRSEIYKLEIDLSIALLNSENSDELSWNRVELQLEEGDVCVEFIYGQLNEDSIRYGALIGKQGWQHPLFIDLCSEKELIRASKSMVGSPMSSMTRGVNVDDLDSYLDPHTFYNLVWAPLEKHIDSEEHIYLAPVGLLNGVAFAALSGNDDVPLIRKYHLNTVLSTKSIGKSRAGDMRFYLLGGVKYEPRNKLELPQSWTDKVVNWEELNGTSREIDGIQQMTKKNKIATEVIKGRAATEEAFNLISYKIDTHTRSVLHIATHGYSFVHPFKKDYNAPRTNNTYLDLVKEPMLRSGLIMAGANEAWNGQYAKEYEDGILTAYEISDLDLQGVELAVLSACETATGDINDTEGVFGLQRAFKLAGVNYIISSLWPVPDESTADFMIKFYANLFEGMSIEEAFIATQRKMSTYTHTVDWAAWVLVR